MTVRIALPLQLGLGEGPFWSAARGALYLVDIVAGAVLCWRPGSGLAPRRWVLGEPVSAAIPRRSGGLVVTLASHVALFDEGDAAVTVPFAHPDPDPTNRANEARCDAAGRLWLGTMQNNITPQGQHGPVTAATGGLFRIDADGAVSRHGAGIGIPNTLCWSPDGGTLYFADTVARRIDAFPFDAASGRLGAPAPFVHGGPGAPDGSAIDRDGFLWTARWGAGCLVRTAPDGRLDRVIELPARQPTSCVFAGTTLFVTTARIDLAAPGEADGALLAIETGIEGPDLHEFAG